MSRSIPRARGVRARNLVQLARLTSPVRRGRPRRSCPSAVGTSRKRTPMARWVPVPGAGSVGHARNPPGLASGVDPSRFPAPSGLRPTPSCGWGARSLRSGVAFSSGRAPPAPRTSSERESAREPRAPRAAASRTARRRARCRTACTPRSVEISFPLRASLSIDEDTALMGEPPRARPVHSWSTRPMSDGTDLHPGRSLD